MVFVAGNGFDLCWCDGVLSLVVWCGVYVRFLFFFVCCDACGRINICKTKFSSPV